jgi:hypothetical protein
LVKETTKASDKATTSPEDLQEFLELLAITGRKTTDLSTEEDRKIQNECWTWIQNGKPAAVMPAMTAKVEVVSKVYRTKRFGNQFLYYRNQDGGNQGKEFVKTYDQVPVIKDGKPTGEFQDDKDTVTSTKAKYTIPYTKPLGEELVEKALATSLEPTFYFVQGDHKFSVEAEEFNGNFDTMIKMCMRNLKP